MSSEVNVDNPLDVDGTDAKFGFPGRFGFNAKWSLTASGLLGKVRLILEGRRDGGAGGTNAERRRSGWATGMDDDGSVLIVLRRFGGFAGADVVPLLDPEMVTSPPFAVPVRGGSAPSTPAKFGNVLCSMVVTNPASPELPTTDSPGICAAP